MCPTENRTSWRERKMMRLIFDKPVVRVENVSFDRLMRIISWWLERSVSCNHYRRVSFLIWTMLVTLPNPMNRIHKQWIVKATICVHWYAMEIDQLCPVTNWKTFVFLLDLLTAEDKYVNSNLFIWSLRKDVLVFARETEDIQLTDCFE